MKIYTQVLSSCPECPDYQDEDVDVYHGCRWIPARCKKMDMEIIGEDSELDFPTFCPLQDKESK